MPISNPSMPSVPGDLHVEDLTLDGTALLITVRTTAAPASYRVCGRASARVHSTYWRMFKDLPWLDRAVTWRVQVRRFRCSHCPGRIFAERVPGLGARKACRSDRLAKAQTDIGMVLGGEPTARLSRRLAMPVSGTIVCDLERRRVIDPLLGRSSAPVRDWLAAHPSVTVVSRDRSGPYAEAARTRAPTATQVELLEHRTFNRTHI